MKLKLNKKKLKNLAKDNKALPADMTPNIAGGIDIPHTCLMCPSDVCISNAGDCESILDVCLPSPIPQPTFMNN